jgi:hypothetical protein
MEIIRVRNEHRIMLCHASYIEKITKRFGLTEQNIVPTIPIPVVPYMKFEGTATAIQIKLYQETIGSLLYTAIMIRLDVAFAASMLSRFLTNPSPAHQEAAFQAIRYLYHTRFLCIQYGGSTEIQVLAIATDASFADDQDTRRSSQGMVITLFGGPVVWKASRQPTVSTSTTEAELLALEQTAKETVALKRLFRDLAFDPEEEYNIRCDNQQTIRLVIGEGQRISTRLRHVDIQNMWLRQEYEKKTFELTYIPTNEMPADGLTKALPRQKFEYWRALMNLQDKRKWGVETEKANSQLTKL